MKKSVFLFSALILILAFAGVFVFAGTAAATNGYQLIGVGQIQKSMGGAVTAAPMDAMTAITNPAGMARIGIRADFSMEAFMPSRSVDFSAVGGDVTKGGAELYGIPSVGWTAPALGRDDVYFGGGMFATSGLGVDYGQSVFMPGPSLDQMAGAPAGTFSDVTFDGYSAIQFWKMAPTFAWNVNDTLSLGASVNMDYQSVTIRQAFGNVPFWNNPMDPTAGITQRNVNFDLGRPTSQMGAGIGLGLLYDINDMITFGASYSSKQIFSDAEFRVASGDILNYNGAVGLAGKYNMELNYPHQAAVGVAIRPMDALLLAFDLKWIGWSGTHEEVNFSGPANSFDTTGDGVGNASSTTLDFGWEDQIVYAMGAQYLATEALTLRAGYNYSQAPIDEADVFNNLVLPAVVEHHLSVGMDYKLGPHWGVGMTYMRAFNEEIVGKGDVPAGFQMMTPFTADSGSTISLEENSVGIQLTYRF